MRRWKHLHLDSDAYIKHQYIYMYVVCTSKHQLYNSEYTECNHVEWCDKSHVAPFANMD